jgi:predicted 3-demethylubiquinone-9 3-methyltransferase (glyoxalase superfamily)
MFQGKAEEAMRLYTSLIPNSRIDEITRWGPGGPGAEGTVMQARFTIAGQTVRCTDSPAVHAFTFTPSFSFFVDCESEAQLRALFAALADGGKTMMPVSNYGFSQLFGWTSDRFGVSWQLSLP